jgi:hypothetical protein
VVANNARDMSNVATPAVLPAINLGDFQIRGPQHIG